MTVVAAQSSRIGVVIVNWNGGEMLSRVVRGLMQQTLPDFRLLLIDNASTDDSVKQAARLCPWMEILPQTSNLGFAAANNLAVRHMDNCDWIALLNPDAVPDPHWLEALLDAAESHPDYQLFGSKQLCFDHPERIDGLGDAYHVSGLPWRIGYGRLFAAQDNLEMEIFSPCAAAALYRRTAFLAVGGFDERFFCYMEDVDLGFRLRLAGYRALYVPDAQVLHAGSGITRHLDGFALYHGHRNLIWTYFKNMPDALFWRYLLMHCAMNVFTIFYFLLRGQGGVVIRAKWHALQRMPEFWAERRKIQAKKVASNASILRVMQRQWWPKRRS